MLFKSISIILAVFQWLKIWSTKPFFHKYQQFLISRQSIPPDVPLLFVILTYELLNSLYLYLVPLSTHQRAAHFDFSLVWFCAQHYNIANISLIIATSYLLFAAYYLAPTKLKLRYGFYRLSAIVYNENDEPFLEKRISTRWSKTPIPICLYIQKLEKWYIRLVVYNGASFMGLMLLLNCYQAVRFLWKDFGTFTYAEIGQLVIGKLALDLEQGSTLLILTTFAYFTFTFTMVTFIQLRQAQRLVSKKRDLSRLAFNRFAAHHAATLVAILQFKPWIAYFMFGFGFTQLPNSTHFLGRIALGEADLLTASILLPCVGFQYVIIFGYHYLAAFYTRKIHACAKPLMQLNARKFISGPPYDLFYHLKVAGYIEKMHTENAYGIDFGDGQTISMFSFFQFVLFYGQVLMFSYQLMETSP